MAAFSTAHAPLYTPINMHDLSLVTYGTNNGTADTRWSWINGGADSIHVYGTSFTYSGTHATGGNVSAVAVDLSNNQVGSASNADIYISGLTGVDITRLDDSAESFWGEVLAGADTIDLTGLSSFAATDISYVFGDDFDTPEASFLGGSDSGVGDTITIGNSIVYLAGDVWSVDGYDFMGLAYFTSYTGGNDTITSSAGSAGSFAAGDAWKVGLYGTLNGGDDVINQSLNVGDDNFAIGDVRDQQDGTVNGGNDTLTAASFGNASSSNVAVGDVYSMTGGTLTGGDDVIRAGTDGRLTAAGDVYGVSSGVIRVTGGDDIIHGAGMNDLISGDAGSLSFAGRLAGSRGGDDVIWGYGGDDQIYGDEGWGTGTFDGGNDRIYGGSGDDLIKGQGGDDFLAGGQGDDTIDGGSGNDWASYAGDAAVSVDLALSGAQDTGGAGHDVLTDIENLLGSPGNDTLSGDDSANSLDGGTGNDTLRGRGGQDKLSGGFGDDILFGGDDEDSLDGGFGNDRLQGGYHDDILIGGAGSDWADYTDFTNGSALVLSLRTANWQNTPDGYKDKLQLVENIDSGVGDDVLKGSDGANSIKGNDGNDVINGFDGQDFLWGGNGNDRLYGAGGNDFLVGDAGDDRLKGNDGNDALYGATGNDVLYGGAGDDVLDGQEGDDYLYGQNGADVLRGGVGDDKLYGSHDNAVDKFVFAAGYGDDRVRGFEDGHDVIDLSAYGFADKAAAMAYASQTGWGAVKFDLSSAPGGQAGDVLYVENMTLNTDFTDADIIV